ncbi:MAG: phosphatidylglycerophosphatase A [Pseudomonadota bacterium]
MNNTDSGAGDGDSGCGPRETPDAPSPSGPCPSALIGDPLHLLAFGLGSGLAPRAPGTFGTLAALPLAWLVGGLSLATYSVVCLALAAIAIYVAGRAARALRQHDHGAIVIDEVAGLLWGMWAVPPTLTNLLLAFALFRFFDIVKPWPIGWVDRNTRGGFGIVADDLLAGVATAASLNALNAVVMI